MRNLSMKKFGTPTGAGPAGSASEKVGSAGASGSPLARSQPSGLVISAVVVSLRPSTLEASAGGLSLGRALPSLSIAPSGRGAVVVVVVVVVAGSSGVGRRRWSHGRRRRRAGSRAGRRSSWARAGAT